MPSLNTVRFAPRALLRRPLPSPHILARGTMQTSGREVAP
jgi:hypothetical protein